MSCSLIRLDALRKALATEGIDAFLVRNISNIHWLTAFDAVFDGEDAHALLVTPDRAILHTDTRYIEACKWAADGTDIEVDASPQTHAECARAVLGEVCAAQGRALTDITLGIEATMSLAEYRKLEKTCAEEAPVFRETDGLVLALREVKDASEIARMKEAQEITDAAFTHIIGFIRPGMTEREVQIELEGYMVKHGAEGLAFSSIVAAGAKGASPHAIPGATVLELGQAVVLDFGATWLGYCSDMTRTVFLGEPSPELREAYQVLRRANEEVQAMLKPGVSGADAHAHAEKVLAAGGFAGKMGHGLGHGVGIDIHEEPVLAPRNQEPLSEGNVVTVEPGIYIAGDFGMRLEDFGVVTHDGFEVFTQSTHEMVIL